MAGYKLSYTGEEIDEKLGKIDNLAEKKEIPTKLSELENDKGFMTELSSEDINEIAEEVVLTSKWNNIGETPLVTPESNNYRLKADGEATYTLKSDSVVVIDENTVWSKVYRCTANHDKGYWEIIPDGTTTNVYSCYIQKEISGLVVGQQYKLIIDGRNLTNDLTNGTPWMGYVQLLDANSTVYAKYQPQYTTPNPSYDQITFTATEETTILRVQLGISKFTLANVIVNFHKIYINHVDGGNEATQIANTTATFTDSVVLGQLEKGISITSTPSCKVYNEIPEKTVHIPKSRHEGKVCVCFGDSIVGNMKEPNDYPTVLGDITGMTVYNAGFGGCRMSASMEGRVYDNYSMVKIVDAIISGDWSAQEGGLEEAGISHYGPHIETLKNMNWNKVDFITIGYGTNDIANFVPVDNTDEEYNSLDTTTVLGALRYSLTQLLTKYPHLKVLILTPIYRYFNNEGVDSDEKEWYEQREFTTWTDGILEVAKEFKVPGVDMYRTLGFNKITRVYYYPSTDGTHPNAIGLKVIASKIAGKLLSEY